MDNPYADLVSQFQALNVKDPAFSRRLHELVGVTELLTTLNTARTLEETLDIILLTVLGEYGARSAAIYIMTSEGWKLGIAKGMRNQNLDLSGLPNDPNTQLPKEIRCAEDLPAGLEVFLDNDLFEVVFPALNDGKLVGFICVGRSLLGPAAELKLGLLNTIADFGGVIIGNSLYRDDLEKVNRQLQRRIFQLNTLYEITGAFARCYENEQVWQVLSNNLMGQFFISRTAVLEYEAGCRVSFKKGIKMDNPLVPGQDEVRSLEDWPRGVTGMDLVQCPSIAYFMRSNRLQYALPIASESHRLGLLLLGGRLDGKQLSEEDKDFILSMSQQSAVAVENVRLQKEEAEKKRMEKELQLAREIQQKLLPKSVPVINGYELAVEMRPYYLVGGDFYDFIILENGRLCVCLADVSGKSLPASMIMSTAQASLRALNSFSGLSPRDVIEKLNLHMCQSTQSNKFITLFYAVLCPETHTLQYINAGHNRPILIHPDHSFELLDKGGMVVGMFPSASYQVGTVKMDPGTELLIYTDGLSEVTDREGEEFGDDRLVETLRRKRGQGTVEQEKDDIVREVMDFSSDSMVDDMTLLLLRRRAP
ncbi:MAG: PP2C family protein-serine/threonine phosphatase [Acidobacteriota bacterium]|nr:PP2C family protein-serine/threonine phosphatase [Acidobacteriota bacterium]